MLVTLVLSRWQVDRLRYAIDPFLGSPHPTLDQWRNMSDDELWQCVVGRVASLESVAEGDSQAKAPSAGTNLSWSRFIEQSDQDVGREVHEGTEQPVGTGAGGAISEGNRPLVLLRISKKLKDAGGPGAYFRVVADQADDLNRVDMIRQDFGDISGEDAVTMLLDLGMVSGFLSFDSRVQKVLAALRMEDDEFDSAVVRHLLEETILRAVPELGVASLFHLNWILVQNIQLVMDRIGPVSS